MQKIQTEVLVIGGGATGTGVLRDLAMRGFETMLVEKRDLTHGTTGRFHGLLHSGGRYVVKDSVAAKECFRENRILRHIMPHCIEDTGGFFVVTPWDDPGYSERFTDGCLQAGIPYEEIPISQMLREEPLLNPKISCCYRLPDASVDSFLAAHVNVESAKEYGAQIRTYHKVNRLLVADENSEYLKVVGALCHDLIKDESIEIHADIVVNASGAWAGKIGATIGLEILIRPGKGTMLAVNHRVINTVVNRCRTPSDGDIIVPAHTVAVMGTTDVQVRDPDHFAIEPWEIRLMLEEGEKVIPGFKDLRVLRAWAGVRPLYQETKTNHSREITRTYVLLDHEERDGVSGLVTITSGKWTTYRLMAEVAVDKVCQKLGTTRECQTHLELLPTSSSIQGNHGGEHTKPQYNYLGERLSRIEAQKKYTAPICECELATRADIERAITIGEAKTLDDIRRDVRLGMGPCQGAFCTFRAAGILHELRQIPIQETNLHLLDFLQERWKGLLPILWGQQLRQERLGEMIYRDLLNLDHLPGPKQSRLGTKMYAPPSYNEAPPRRDTKPVEREIKPNQSLAPKLTSPSRSVDVLVIGAGLAGLTTAWRAASRGYKVMVITQGWGATHWGAGCVDVLGYYPLEDPEPLSSPVTGLEALIQRNPRHPYAIAGMENVEKAIKIFQVLCSQSNYPLSGALEQNWSLPTAAGAIRPSCLIPETMIAGDLKDQEPILLVGFTGYHDFYPQFIAENLEAQGLISRWVSLDLPSIRSLHMINSMTIARLFHNSEFRQELSTHLKPQLENVHRVGFPAILGIHNPTDILKDLESHLDRRVFEISTLPPSIPGIRLHSVLVNAVRVAGGSVETGMRVHSFDGENGHVNTVWTEAAARLIPHHANNFVLATGGILGGGFETTYDGNILESVFKLPLYPKIDQSKWLRTQFLSGEGHPIYTTGVEVSTSFRPTNPSGSTLYDNLFVIGGNLAHAQPFHELSLPGIALSSGYVVGENVNFA